MQYNAALAITGAIRGTSKEKLYQELGLEYLSKRRWFKRLSTFYRIQDNQYPLHLFNLIPPSNNNYNTRNKKKFGTIFCRTELFKNSFLPYVLNEWNKLESKIRESQSFQSFRKSLLSLIRPSPNSCFGVHNPHGLKLLTRLRLGLSHLREHKFKHNFQDTLNPLCSCSLEVESTDHFLLRCQYFNNQRATLLDKLKIIDSNITGLSDMDLTRLILFGDENYTCIKNTNILNVSIEYIVNTGRFDVELF